MMPISHFAQKPPTTYVSNELKIAKMQKLKKSDSLFALWISFNFLGIDSHALV